jgi:hypothetical protein
LASDWLGSLKNDVVRICCLHHDDRMDCGIFLLFHRHRLDKLEISSDCRTSSENVISCDDERAVTSIGFVEEVGDRHHELEGVALHPCCRTS